MDRAGVIEFSGFGERTEDSRRELGRHRKGQTAVGENVTGCDLPRKMKEMGVLVSWKYSYGRKKREKVTQERLRNRKIASSGWSTHGLVCPANGNGPNLVGWSQFLGTASAHRRTPRQAPGQAGRAGRAGLP